MGSLVLGQLIVRSVSYSAAVIGGTVASPEDHPTRITGRTARRGSGFVFTRRSRRSAQPASLLAAAALDPLVAPARAVANLQDGPEESGIARVPVLALGREAEGGWVLGVQLNTTIGGLVVGVL